MAGQYDDYAPIQAEDLPAKYTGCFSLLDLTFTPPNDFDRVMTITGKSLQLVTDNDNDGRKGKQLVMHAGYQKAIWELREGHLRYCPSQQRLWRRDPDVEDHHGDRYLLNSWHPIKSIEDEYHIGNSSNDRSRNYAMSATILRESKRSQWFKQVERGVRIDPCVWYRKGGCVICVRGDTDMAVTQTFDPKGMSNQAIEQAVNICKWLTVDDKSCSNLLRMFATPWLEPFKQLSYVLSGHGGDGKTLLMVNAVQAVLGDRKSYPAFSAAKYCEKGFSLSAESMNDAMAGMAFAYDDEAAEVTDDMLPALRSLSTGATVNARVVGGKYYSTKPTATIVILTNMPFADSSEPSDKRRFVKIEMHRSDGRSFDEYHAIELFIREHPAAFYAASCRLWEKSDEPELVNLSPARAISDEMYWIISEILTNEEKYGQSVASRDAYRDEFHKPIPRDVMALLGLTNSTSRSIGDKQKRVVRVEDMSRFDVYRKAIKAEEHDDDAQSDVPEPPVPLELDSQLAPSLFGFQCDYVPANPDKSAFNWKKLALDPAVDTGVVPNTPAYAVVPASGFMVIDMDMSKTDGEDGWTVLNRRVGRYGSKAFPATYLVRTPSGGLHAYYRVPDALQGKVKNAVHLKTSEYPDGIPVDLRVERKGYVIGAGSHVNEGDYKLCDLPGDDGIPEASVEICRWLEAIGCIEGKEPTRITPAAPRHQLPASKREPIRLSLAQVMAGDDQPRRQPSPDMTPVPEGQRNQTLHDWAFGRALNHPENWPAIESDLYARGHASGLQDSELATIWKSITRQLSGKE